MQFGISRLFRRRWDLSRLKRPLALVHIPKTAGTAFVNYLAAGTRFPGCIAPAIVKNSDQIEWQNPQFKLFFGHFPYRDFKPRLPNGSFVTFLRDPVERTVSFYHSWSDPKKLGATWRSVMSAEQLADVEFAQKSTLNEFVLTNRPKVILRLTDVQTRMLSTADPDSNDFLDSAKENLERHMSYFGITEEFMESIELFRAAFPGAPEYRLSSAQENRSNKRGEELSSRALDRVAELNRNDQALYDFALTLFRRRCGAMRRNAA